MCIVGINDTAVVTVKCMLLGGELHLRPIEAGCLGRRLFEPGSFKLGPVPVRLLDRNSEIIRPEKCLNGRQRGPQGRRIIEGEGKIAGWR